MIISKSYKSIIILSLLLKNTTHGCMKCCTKSTCESHVSIRKQECQVYYHNYLYCAETYGCRNEGIDIAQFIPCENCQGDLPENKKCKEEFDAFVKDAKASMNDLKNLKNDLAEQWIKTQSWFELLNENQKAVLADNAAKFDAINKRFDQLDEDNKRLLENQEKLQYGLKNLMQSLEIIILANDIYYTSPDIEKWVYHVTSVIMIVISVFGISSNSFVIGAYIRNKKV